MEAGSEPALHLQPARRTSRDPQRQSLPPIGSLRYFLPIIREILDKPVDPGEISLPSDLPAGLVALKLRGHDRPTVVGTGSSFQWSRHLFGPLAVYNIDF